MADTTVSVAADGFTFAVGKQPVDLVLLGALSEKMVTESDAFCAKQSRPGSGEFVSAITHEGPIGYGRIGTGRRPDFATQVEGYNKQYVFQRLGIAMGFNTYTMRKLLERRDQVSAKLTIEAFIEGLKRCRLIWHERTATQILLNADDSTYAYSDVTVPDGQSLLYTAHTYTNTGETYSNMAAAYTAPTKATIETARRLKWAIQDVQGGYRPYARLNLLISPKNAADNELQMLFKSSGNILNAAARDVNPINVLNWGDVNLREIRHFNNNTSWYMVPDNAKDKPIMRWDDTGLKMAKENDEMAETVIHGMWEWMVYACLEPNNIYGVVEGT